MNMLAVPFVGTTHSRQTISHTGPINLEGSANANKMNDSYESFKRQFKL